jgi:predicted aspartyl protease
VIEQVEGTASTGEAVSGRSEERLTTCEGRINSQRVTILMDTGASISLMSAELARALELETEDVAKKVNGISTPISASKGAQVKLSIGPITRDVRMYISEEHGGATQRGGTG